MTSAVQDPNVFPSSQDATLPEPEVISGPDKLMMILLMASLAMFLLFTLGDLLLALTK